MNPSAPAQPLLSLRRVSKRFGSVDALVDIDLDLHTGEVHAVLGENGAGKSTLMNAIYGLVQIDTGLMRWRGETVRFRTPLDARRAGIGMVHQEFALIDALSVIENLTLSLSTSNALLWPRQAVAAAATRLADAVGLELSDLSAPVGALPVGARQRIEILKALAGKPKLLILDEPTSVLTPTEVSHLFGMLDRLRGSGTAVLFITHKLSEVMTIGDRVTIMRRGHVVAQTRRQEVSETELARLMVGPLPLGAARQPRRDTHGAVAQLRIDRLSVTDQRGVLRLRDLSLDIRSAEIFGLAGVDGNGQWELFEVRTGLRQPTSGRLSVAGKPLTQLNPAAMIAAGIGNIPPDRQRQGVIPAMSVQENAVLNQALLRRLAWGPFSRPQLNRRVARDLVDRYAIKAESLEAPVSSLSGGNVQRLIVARALTLEPSVLVAFNPTRGLDIGATQAVHTALDAALERGAAVLLISTDLEEILAVSDRMAVLYRGQLSAVLHPPFPTDRLGPMLAGSMAVQ